MKLFNNSKFKTFKKRNITGTERTISKDHTCSIGKNTKDFQFPSQFILMELMVNIKSSN